MVAIRAEPLGRSATNDAAEAQEEGDNQKGFKEREREGG